MGVTDRVWCEDLMTRTLSSQCLHHDTLLWLINVTSVHHLLTAEGLLMGDLTSGEDCCLRQQRETHRAQALVRHLFLPALHSRSWSARIVHSFLTYPYSNVLGQNIPLAHLWQPPHTIEYHSTPAQL